MESIAASAFLDLPTVRWQHTERALRLFADLMSDDVSNPTQRIAELEQENERLTSENEHQRLLLAEARHRAKNMFALMQAMVSQTLRRASSTEDASEALAARIAALGHAQNMLFEASCSGANIKNVVSEALAPHNSLSEAGRIVARGPAAWLDEKQTLALSLALHELGTNATKYGALSNASGHVEIVWRMVRRSSGRVLHLTWREQDGPPVSTPKSEGFGSKLIRRVLAGSLGGEVKLRFAASGLVCTVDMALHTVP